MATHDMSIEERYQYLRRMQPRYQQANRGDKLAADIKRRFLPDYITLFLKRVAVKTETEAAIAATNAILDELGALTGGRVIYVEKGKQGSVYLERGRLDTYPHDPPDFHLDVRWLSLEMTRRLCEVLVGTQGGK
ncbi:MAG: hypothetical protein JXR84_03555 [Anaerolineae bacterium]|nr:hypothetical protein [Anaerolineae bacterium]